MNNYLEYFPYDVEVHPNGHQKLSDEDLIMILDGTIKPHWRQQMAKDGQALDAFPTLQQARDYFTRLEMADAMEGRSDDSPDSKAKKPTKRKRDDPKEKRRTQQNGGQECKHCGKKGHPDNKCWELEANKGTRPKNWKSVKGKLNEAPELKIQETNRAPKRTRLFKDITNVSPPITVVPNNIEQGKEPNLKKRSREVLSEAAQPNESAAAHTIPEAELDTHILCPMKAMMLNNNNSNSDNESSDEEFDGYLPQYLFPFFNRDHLNKKTKVGHYTAEIVVEIWDKNNKLVPIRAL